MVLAIAMIAVRWLAIVSFLAVAPALADPNEDPSCESDGQPALGIVQIGSDERATFYVDDRNAVTGNGVWLYQEYNGVFDPDAEPIRNLQRGGSGDHVHLPPYRDEICTDANPAGPDYILLE